MSCIDVGTEVFYIHNDYDEPPRIRKGVIVDLPSGLETASGYSIRPIEHKHASISTIYLSSHKIYLIEFTAWCALASTINSRIVAQLEEVQKLQKQQRLVFTKMAEVHSLDMCN